MDKCSMLWSKFEKTGSVEDYLKYRTEYNLCKVNNKKENSVKINSIETDRNTQKN